MVKNAITPPTECPVCGEAVPRTALACPGCGADERSGWNEEAARYDGLDLPAEAREKIRCVSRDGKHLCCYCENF